MKKSLLFTLPAVIAFILFVFTICSAGEIVDITSENREALSENVDRLQHTELYRVSRGRLKPNPILFPYHTIYQTVLQDQEYLLGKHTDAFENTLMRLNKVFAEYSDTAFSIDYTETSSYFRKELVALFSIRDELENQDTLIGVWNVLEASRIGMEALPLRASLAFNAKHWLCVLYKESPLSLPVQEQLYTIIQNTRNLENIFEMDRYLQELSAEYSRFFYELTTENEETDPKEKENQ